jgi:hypothetical protein
MKKRVSSSKIQWDVIQQSVVDLNRDIRFQRYLEGLYGLKDVAVGEACHKETLSSPTLISAALGRIQGFQDMIDFIEANMPKGEDEPEQEATP